MNRNILILFMSWLGVTGYGQATSPNETPITIARQGSFAVGGTVLHRPGKYDNSRFITGAPPLNRDRAICQTMLSSISRFRPRPTRCRWFSFMGTDSQAAAGK